MRYRDIIEHRKSLADTNTKPEQAQREQDRRKAANDRLKAADSERVEAQRRYNRDIQQTPASAKTAQTDRAEALQRFQRARAAADKAAQAARQRLRGDK